VGTGNDFARTIGIPLDPEDAAHVVLARRLGPIDLVIDDAGTAVVNNARVGIGAEASRQASNWKERLGRLGYAVGAAHAALGFRSLRLLIEVDDEL